MEMDEANFILKIKSPNYSTVQMKRARQRLTNSLYRPKNVARKCVYKHVYERKN